ncbi:MAG TPA: RNA ligase family protein [Longimicrobiales bacterium]|nr:RNA ligase family protein [Longimicrobiales bacterium]
MSRVPEWLEPMAATLTQERFSGPEWLFERKLDGIRMLAFKDATQVRLLSRNRLAQNDSYPAIVDAVLKLPVQNAILDGEATGVWGARGRVAYHVFDILWLNDKSVTALPLEERRALLQALPLHSPLERVAALQHAQPWDHACRAGWEGVIAKRRDAPYEHRRSRHWLKMKCELVKELLIGGFTDPQGARVGLGALLVGYFDGADFVYAGKVGTGLDTRRLLEMRARLDALEIETPPFTRATGLPRVRAHWVRPQVSVRVAFIEWTVNGKLRHPRLLAG